MRAIPHSTDAEPPAAALLIGSGTRGAPRAQIAARDKAKPVSRHLQLALVRRAALLLALCAAAALSTFAPYLPAALVPEPLGWLLGLAAHWQWAYLALAVPAAAPVLGLRRGRRAWVLLPLGLVGAAWLHHAPAAPEARAPDASALSLRVASANLNLQQRDHAALAAWLLGADAPDLIALQEFTGSAQALVNQPALRAAYPHRVLAPSEDPFGLALLSKHPIGAAEPVQAINPLATLKLRLRLELRGHPLAVTVVHPMPPLNAAYARERDASLRLEAERLSQAGMPGILLGDLNATPWSTGLRASAPLLRASSLRPTWPNAWGWLSVLPLDHVLVTPELRVDHSSLGPDLGSDHRPVLVQLVLP